MRSSYSVLLLFSSIKDSKVEDVRSFSLVDMLAASSSEAVESFNRQVLFFARSYNSETEGRVVVMEVALILRKCEQIGCEMRVFVRVD